MQTRVREYRRSFLISFQVKKDEHSRYQIVLFIAADESCREEEQAALRVFGALPDEERRARTDNLLLRSAAKRGIFHVANPQHRSYRVIYDFDLRYIVGICKQSVKNVDVATILKEDGKRTNSFRCVFLLLLFFSPFALSRSSFCFVDHNRRIAPSIGYLSSLTDSQSAGRSRAAAGRRYSFSASI